jgi:phosphatidylethanolamine/phosphatidyl-N-methylethanolamine N-methyltransferase
MARSPSSLVNRSLRSVHRQLYTRFAWTYDIFAWMVSRGEWQQWGRAAIPFIPTGARVLEIGHGSGHLHLALCRRGLRAVGIDLSAQMGALTAQRFARAMHGARPRLARADAHRLPFAAHSLECIVCAFPAGFIFAEEMLREAHRVLTERGRIVIVPHAVLRRRPLRRVVRLARGLGGQGAPGIASADLIRAALARAGFTLELHAQQTRRADVTVWVCQREDV